MQHFAAWKVKKIDILSHSVLPCFGVKKQNITQNRVMYCKSVSITALARKWWLLIHCEIVLFFLYLILSYENSATYEHFWFFQVLKLWQSVTLLLLKAHGQVVPFWKPPISHCLKPGVHRNSRAIMAQNRHSKMANL